MQGGDNIGKQGIDTAIFLLEEYYKVALPLSEKNGHAYWK
jgi:hypothetical protein